MAVKPEPGPLGAALQMDSLRTLDSQKDLKRPSLKKGVLLLSPLIRQGYLEPREFYVHRLMVMACNMPHVLVPIYLNDFRVQLRGRVDGWLSYENDATLTVLDEIKTLPLMNNGIYRGTLELLLRAPYAFVVDPKSAASTIRGMEEPLFRQRALGVVGNLADVIEMSILRLVRNIDWIMTENTNALLRNVEKDGLQRAIADQKYRSLRITNSLRFLPDQFLPNGAPNPWWTLAYDAFVMYHPNVLTRADARQRSRAGAGGGDEESSASSSSSGRSRSDKDAKELTNRMLGLIDQRKATDLLPPFQGSLDPEAEALNAGLHQCDFIFHFVVGRMGMDRLEAAGANSTYEDVQAVCDNIVVGVRYFLNWVTPGVPGTIEASPTIFDRPDVRDWLVQTVYDTVPDSVSRLYLTAPGFVHNNYDWAMARDYLTMLIRSFGREAGIAFLTPFRQRAQRGLDTLTVDQAIAGLTEASPAQRAAYAAKVEAQKRRDYIPLPDMTRRNPIKTPPGRVAPPSPAPQPPPPMEQLQPEYPDAGLLPLPFDTEAEPQPQLQYDYEDQYYANNSQPAQDSLIDFSLVDPEQQSGEIVDMLVGIGFAGVPGN
jgi:hypothetical protein